MKKFSTILLLVVLCLSGCTANERAKRFGGEQTIEVPSGHKVIDVTWKEDDIWYAYRPMREGEQAETVTFQAKSNFGIFEGKVVFEESK